MFLEAISKLINVRNLAKLGEYNMNFSNIYYISNSNPVTIYIHLLNQNLTDVPNMHMKTCIYDMSYAELD